MKGKFFKIVSISLIILLVSTLLTSCGRENNQSRNNDTPNQTSSEGQKVILVWSYWGDPWEIEINKKIASKFEETHPNIKIEQQYAPWNDYFDKLQTQWAGNSSPDVMFLTNVPSYASKGVLEDLGPYIKQNNYKIDDYYPEALKLFQYNGKLYGVPRDNDTKVLFYNKKLFDEAKLPYPDKNLTWDKLVELAKKLTIRDNTGRAKQYGIAFDPGMWFLYVWMNGGAIFDDEIHPTKVLLGDSKAIEGLQKLGDLIIKEKVSPSYELIKDSSQIAQMFLTNQVAMVIGNHALIPSFLAAKDLQWDVSYLPTMGNNLKVNIAGGAGYCISSKSKHKKEAWEFWTFLTGPEAQKMFTESNLIVPANKEVLNSDVFLKQNYNAKVFADETAVGKTHPSVFEGWDKFWTLSLQYFEAIWTGDKTAEDAVKTAMPEFEKIVSGQ